jgi:GNAT superfamily N-acetyltransferase
MQNLGISYRRCRKKDMLPSVRLVLSSLDDIRVRTGKEPMDRRVQRVPGFFDHLLRTDRDTFYCAWRRARLVGFAGAIVRGKQWYLAWLFVHPRYQDRGIGRKLLEKVWRDRQGMSHSLVTMTYNVGAVGLYGRFGMVPETLITLMGTPRDRLKVPKPTGLEIAEQVRASDLAWINALEREIRGYPHPSEWRYWHGSDKHRILLFRRGRSRIGYSMISLGTGICPVAAARRRDLRDVLAETLRIAARPPKKERKPGKLIIFLPEEQKSIYTFLLDSGFRNREMLVFMSDHSYPDFRRYIPASPAVL